MRTDKEALQIAKEELRRALYLSECSRSAGIRAINEDKAEWLSILIRSAEQYMRKELERISAAQAANIDQALERILPGQ